MKLRTTCCALTALALSCARRVPETAMSTQSQQLASRPDDVAFHVRFPGSGQRPEADPVLADPRFSCEGGPSDCVKVPVGSRTKVKVRAADLTGAPEFDLRLPAELTAGADDDHPEHPRGKSYAIDVSRAPVGTYHFDIVPRGGGGGDPTIIIIPR